MTVSYVVFYLDEAYEYVIKTEDGPYCPVDFVSVTHAGE